MRTASCASHPAGWSRTSDASALTLIRQTFIRNWKKRTGSYPPTESSCRASAAETGMPAWVRRSFVGAFQYYAAAAAGPNGVKLVCYPDKHPTRNQIIALFVQWAKAHPEYMAPAVLSTRRAWNHSIHQGKEPFGVFRAFRGSFLRVLTAKGAKIAKVCVGYPDDLSFGVVAEIEEQVDPIHIKNHPGVQQVHFHHGPFLYSSTDEIFFSPKNTCPFFDLLDTEFFPEISFSIHSTTKELMLFPRIVAAFEAILCNSAVIRSEIFPEYGFSGFFPISAQCSR